MNQEMQHKTLLKEKSPEKGETLSIFVKYVQHE